MYLSVTVLNKLQYGLRQYTTVAEHVPNDVCFIPIMGLAILKMLSARRRFSRFYDTEEYLLEDKRTSEVS